MRHAVPRAITLKFRQMRRWKCSNGMSLSHSRMPAFRIWARLLATLIDADRNPNIPAHHAISCICACDGIGQLERDHSGGLHDEILHVGPNSEHIWLSPASMHVALVSAIRRIDDDHCNVGEWNGASAIPKELPHFLLQWEKFTALVATRKRRKLAESKHRPNVACSEIPHSFQMQILKVHVRLSCFDQREICRTL